MTEPLTAAMIERCGRHIVEIDQEAVFGILGPRDVLLQTPVNVRKGIHDVDFGAYTDLAKASTSPTAEKRVESGSTFNLSTPLPACREG